MADLAVHEEIAQALAERRPVVALESAVITTGLPREALATPRCSPLNWREDRPANLELGLLMQRVVREAGAVPASVAVLDGTLRIGLSDDQVQRLAEEVTAKASVTGLAHAMASGASGGTTVSATLAACALTPQPIRVFATGGIGGVHRQWAHIPDVSADLRQIAVTPTCVVCAGAKSILDLPATLEALEALGVPVIGYRTDFFPQFYTRGGAELPAAHRLDDVAAVARMCQLHWEALHPATVRAGGVLLANPVPEDCALDAARLDEEIQRAEAMAEAQGITGPQRTPFLLATVAQSTQGDSLQANIALLVNNARLAGHLACEMARL